MRPTALAPLAEEPPSPPPPTPQPSSSSSSSSSASSSASSSSSSTSSSDAEDSEEDPNPCDVPALEYCPSSAELPVAQMWYRGWKVSYRVKTPDIPNTKALMKTLTSRQNKFQDLHAQLPDGWRAAATRSAASEEAATKRSSNLKASTYRMDAREGRAIRSKGKYS